jgi:hypothetical protein
MNLDYLNNEEIFNFEDDEGCWEDNLLNNDELDENFMVDESEISDINNLIVTLNDKNNLNKKYKNVETLDLSSINESNSSRLNFSNIRIEQEDSDEEQNYDYNNENNNDNDLINLDEIDDEELRNDIEFERKNEKKIKKIERDLNSNFHDLSNNSKKNLLNEEVKEKIHNTRNQNPIKFDKTRSSSYNFKNLNKIKCGKCNEKKEFLNLIINYKNTGNDIRICNDCIESENEE